MKKSVIINLGSKTQCAENKLGEKLYQCTLTAVTLNNYFVSSELWGRK